MSSPAPTRKKKGSDQGVVEQKSAAQVWGKSAMLGVALMAVFLVVRHTRAEEDAGRVELLGSTVVSPHAVITAAVAVAGDNSNWTTLATRTGGAFGNRTDSVNLSGNYRYVRVLGTQRSVGNSWGYSIFEVRMFGN